MNAETLVELCKVFVWPALILYLTRTFRAELRDVVTRLINAKLPGGAEFTFGTLETDKTLPRVESTSKGVAPVQGNWSRSANLYWLGHDLMWTRDALLRGAAKRPLLHGLTQASHHLHMLGLENSRDEVILQRIVKQIEDALDSDLTTQLREALDLDLANLIKRIGGLIERTQSDFDPGPAFKRTADV